VSVRTYLCVAHCTASEMPVRPGESPPSCQSCTWRESEREKERGVRDVCVGKRDREGERQREREGERKGV
jgi:hypothetical protein